MTNEDQTTFSIIEKEGLSSIMSKCLDALKAFKRENPVHPHIQIVNLYIRALGIFNDTQWSLYTQLNLSLHDDYIRDKEEIKLNLATQNEQLINLSSLIETQKKNNLELITTRTNALETGLS